MKSINKTYTGDCKKGKANGMGTANGEDSYVGLFKKGYPEGKGVYTWKNGNSFEGNFKKGKKTGPGKMIYKTATLKDSIVTGFWKNDTYLGLYETPYKKIDNSQNVTGVRFTKSEDNIKRVRLYVREDNILIRNPQITIVVHNGLYQELRAQSDFVELTNATFPLKLRATYGREFIEIEILEPGNWDVRVSIENIKGLEDKPSSFN
ncbi:hypothetical protein MHL31_01120 [Lutibacter sp. A80]|uniref:hypothetical protein n=1 Tax=Lutibacter sp. A80 TaxID=2918453 RepID=UPI001F065ADE|nr:hypothetical protein [Lutibacter sp. A80]UMB60829.1 hypothetical protein MHL31_01120 [Lutibacter sp. A80]